MSKEKFSDFDNPFEAIAAFTQMMGSSTSLGQFFGGIMKDPEEVYPYQKLGNMYELRPIPLTAKEAENSRLVDLKYSHLYHNGLKVSDLIFRKGGICHGFKDGYCSLIHYVRTKEAKKNDAGFSFGTHVIINELGEICLNKDGLDYPYHIGGHLASIGSYVYDLRSGKAIAPKSSTTIRGVNCLIVEHQYSSYNKEVTLPLGVYRIDFWTAEITKIDDVK
jgi:hypothetical protein